MNGAKVIGVVCVVWAMVVVVSIVLSGMEMGLWEGLRSIAATRWGVTTLVDLYAGLAFVGVWIVVVEPGAGAGDVVDRGIVAGGESGDAGVCGAAGASGAERAGGVHACTFC